MKTIDIPDDLYTELLEKALDLNYRNPADVIRFLLTEAKNKEVPEGMGTPSMSKNHCDLITKGGTIPHGTKLQGTYKGRRFPGVIDNGTIMFDEKRFRSPSEAAIYVARLQGTPNPSINGWTFWEYFDVKTGNWGNLSRLRRRPESELQRSVKKIVREETGILICECKSKGVYARGKQDGKSFIVLKDSKASLEETPSQPVSNRENRKQLIREGVLQWNNNQLIFTRDYRFNSPSSAAGVVLGRSAYGKLEWQSEK